MKVVPPGWTLPAHVDPDSGLVQPFDILGGPEVTTFPPAAYDGALRERRVFFSPLYGGFWVFTQYEDIVAALRDSGTYGQHLASLPPMPFVHRQIPVSLEPPEHGEWRRVLLGVFTPHQARDLEPTMAAIARETVQQLRGRNECEVFSDFGMVLPSALFAIRIGLDPKSEQFTALQRLGHEIVYGAAAVAETEGPAAGAKHRDEMVTAFDDSLRELVHERRRAPGDDLLSYLAASKIEGGDPNDDALVEACEFIFRAGTDSTATMITYAFLHLARDPELRASLAADAAAGFTKDVVAEFLRFNSFVSLTRVVRRQVQVGDAVLEPGDIVLLPTAAAARDPQKYADPGELSFARGGAHNVAFGSGRHACLGTHEATAELRIALQEFHRAIPDYEIDPHRHPDPDHLDYLVMANKARPSGLHLTWGGDRG